MSMDRKVPEIRFKEFSGEWEQLSFLDCIERIIDFRGRTPKKLGLDWSPSGYRALSALNVKQGYIDFLIDPHFGDQELYDKWMSGSELHQGQVLFTTEAPMGNVAQVPNTDKYILSQRTIAFIVKSEIIEEDFLAVLLRSSKVFRELSALASGGTAKGVSQKVLANLSVSVPIDLAEQATIGNFFQKLDSLIQQHQQKHEKFSNIKKAMLEKMFPKQGETIPDIRFKGFSGEWEEMKLSKVSDKITEKNTSEIYSETFTNSAEFGIISQRDYFAKDISNCNNIGGYYVVQPEDFVYNPRISTLAPCGPINRNTLGRAGIMSPLYTVFRTKDVNTIFIEYFFQTKLWHTFMFLNGDTGARADRFSIKDSVFFELPLLLPTINEQAVIGNYFQKLDALINQHQQQIIKLNNIKQVFLSKMFV
ncbi:TPA: restriction endonuclease subunit S [Klebsiella aerogenes]|uniref:restriction endonuclease subunit S n=1 Tax=Klebsiella aerogenes TaxID=548 RepID=UPI00091E9425|nr:restriction endonuclease subunit S [Klebsiella aerogenes]SFX79094.1 type I restriction enzyme, S subunit [[Enterobacter] aerogenes] [Klebsiella aerogenes]HBS5891157.1 restriction endonuclease subunit S [Klebsiella aerogenes]HBS5893152.1 restriction endonuclease subunit S [Klebsiella aerogenes]